MNKFWQTTPMSEMTDAQWESLCDACGKCCLQKIIDDDSELMYQTRIACSYLYLQTCRCRVYDNRQAKVADCIKISPGNVSEFTWLPDTCAYRLVAQGQDLPAWHPLITGELKSTMMAGMTVKKWAVSETKVSEDRWGEYIIDVVQLDNDN